MSGHLASRLLHSVQQLGALRGTPQAIAWGFAVGIYVGFFPLVGLKTLLSLAVVSLLGGNRIAAVVGVTIHDLSLPVVPMLMRVEYDLGYWLLSHPHHFPEALVHPSAEMLKHLMNWKTMLTSGSPLMLGAALLGVPVAAVSYFAMLGMVKARQSSGRADSHPRR